MKLKAMLPIKLLITKQQLARLAISTNSSWRSSPNQ